MNASKTENWLQIGFQQPKSGFITGIIIPRMD